MEKIPRPGLLSLSGFGISAALGLAGIGLPMLEIGGFWLGLSLSISAAFFLMLAMAAGTLWAWPHARRFLPRIRQYLWLVGGPTAFGLLLGAMEWLLSGLPYRALGIGLVAFVLALVASVVWAVWLSRRLTAERNALLKGLLANAQPSGTRARGTLAVEYSDPSATIERLQEENEALKMDKAALEKKLEEAQPTEGQIGKLTVKGEDSLEVIKRLTAERDALREEKRQHVQDRRRKRIDEWRSVIRNFDFEAEEFGETDTYSQMRPHLRGQVAQMFEGNSTVHLVNRARGDEFVRYELLDEVARIEKEWGLI